MRTSTTPRPAPPRRPLAPRASAADAPPRRPPAARTPEQLASLIQDATTALASVGPRGAFRGVQAATVAATVARDALAAAAAGAPWSPPRTLKTLFERLGATYIKLGQFVASSPSLFPADYVTEFEALLDATEPVPWPVVRRTIERELGAPLGRHFASIDEAPLASASIAQVHAATLASSGARVVVKVQKPGVADTLRADLAFLYVAARAAEFLNPALARGSVAAIAADIRAAMLDELDFTKEAAHVADFAAYLEATGMDAAAACPFVYRALSTRRVLTMERLDGVPLTDMAAVAAHTGRDPAAVLANGLNAWLGSLIAARTFHADVHSGNLLALADGRVGFIDFGIAAAVSPSTWAAVNALVAATASRDYETMARALATMGAADADGVDFDAFGRDLRDVFEAAAAVEPSVTVVVDADGARTPAAVSFDEASVNRLLLTVVRVGDAYGVRFPREFGVLLKQLLYFDRYVTALAPGLAVGADPRVRLADLEARLGGVQKE